MGFPSANPCDMDRTPDERRDILRSFMQRHGLKAASWAQKAGVSANSIYNFLNDSGSKKLSADTYQALARAIGVPVWKLNGDEPEAQSPTAIWVVGHVQAGDFRAAVEWDRSQWYAVDVPVNPRFQNTSKALEVRGPSMNLEYPDGSVVIWVNVLDSRPPRDRDHVIVYSYRDDDVVEATVKELRIVNDQHWLWPRSSDPDHQQPLSLEKPGDHIKRVEICGLVIGGYRPRRI